MLTQQEVDKIDDVVDIFVTSEEEFTAFDITKEVRRTFPNVRHYEVRGEVHTIMLNEASYERTRDFTIHPDGPFVYSPVVAVQPPARTTPNSQPRDISTVAKGLVVNNNPSLICYGTTDKRGRFCVPNGFIKELKNTNGYVGIYVFQKKLHIEANRPSITAYDSILSIDSYDNVRISSKTLVKAGIDPNRTIKCKLNQVARTIEVEND